MNVQNKLALGYIRTKLSILSILSEKMAGEALFQLFCTPFSKLKSDASGAFANQEKVSFLLKGKRVYGYRCNFPSTKTALILHGFSSSAGNFSHFIDPLIKKGYSVLAFDAPAHGESEGKTINALLYAEMVNHIMEEFGPVHALIGHSFGGLAISLALENKNFAHIPQVVLIAPATETTTAIDGALKMLSLKNPKFRTALEEKIERFSGRNAEWFSIRRAIGNFPGEVLWLHDETDRITPITDVLPVKGDNHAHITFHFTNGLGHRRIYRDEAVRQQIMNFLH